MYTHVMQDVLGSQSVALPTWLNAAALAATVVIIIELHEGLWVRRREASVTRLQCHRKL